MLFHALNNKDKLNLIFVSSKQAISSLYDYIPEKWHDKIKINLNNNVIHCIHSNSRLMIKTPNAQPDHFRGIKIDWYEDNGYASYDAWKELLMRRGHGN